LKYNLSKNVVSYEETNHDYFGHMSFFFTNRSMNLLITKHFKKLSSLNKHSFSLPNNLFIKVIECKEYSKLIVSRLLFHTHLKAIRK
jgi:hypothetical protein